MQKTFGQIKIQKFFSMAINLAIQEQNYTIPYLKF